MTLTEAEIAARRSAIEAANASLRIAGLKGTAEGLALLEEWAAGRMTEEEILAAFREIHAPKYP